MTFREWLRQEREARQCSQKHLADEVRRIDPLSRASQTRVSEWERGECVPSLRQFVAVCRALAVSRAAEATGRALWEQAQLADSPAASATP